MMENVLSQGEPSPKVQKLVEVLIGHFRKQLSTFLMWFIFCPVNLMIGRCIMYTIQCNKFHTFFKTTNIPICHHKICNLVLGGVFLSSIICVAMVLFCLLVICKNGDFFYSSI